MTDDVLLEMRGITKEFPGVMALKDVSFSVRPGEIHALVGENGAGKSTLMKVVSGVYPAGTYDGQFFFKGEECRFHGIRESEAKGIVIIHQELALVPHLSITENIFLANEQATRGVINWGLSHRKAIELLKKVGLDETPDTPIRRLGVGKQQLVEIAKALSKNVELLILDEPTSSLNENDSQALLQLLREFRAQGIACVLISHKLNEVESVADTITVLRDGAVIESLDARGGDVTEDRIIRGMVGRDMTHRFPPREAVIGETLLEIKNWKVRHPIFADRMVINDVSINVKRGEVVGIAGLMGAGRTEFAMSVFGRSWGHFVSGQVLKDGKEIDVSTIPRAVANGIAYATEDRKTYGLVLINDVKTNITMANLPGVSNAGVLIPPKEIKIANEYRDALAIKTPSVKQITVNLSGGNQQKVVLSKWLFANPDVLILDEPTRGIDVGAKYEIYTIINRLAAEGKSIIIISSELPEVLGVADRIYVMAAGRIAAEMPAAEATQESIMKAIMQMARAGAEEVVL
ncbi:MAG TPA: multiple monosaccharide ABC transporter ATP-binding protein [Candidatus Limnocylindrales bacterium]|nr:multiple monosaccharide ABC transporter ATP-binding protein [Candidatus Limnocylindrales bacterium]